MTRTRTIAACMEAADRDARLPRVTEPIDWDALNRLSAYAAKCRREMGEARWNELNKEWEA